MRGVRLLMIVNEVFTTILRKCRKLATAFMQQLDRSERSCQIVAMRRVNQKPAVVNKRILHFSEQTPAIESKTYQNPRTKKNMCWTLVLWWRSAPS